MKKTSITIILTFLSTVMAFGADGDNFRAVTAEGVSVKFKVISEEDKTCSVGWNSSSAAVDSNTTEGTVTIPSEANGYTVVNIGEYAFYDCKKITNVVLPETITSLERWAFYNSGITSILLPESLSTIKVSAFLNCASLTSVNLPSQLTSLGASAFSGCSSLQTIDIPEGIIYIQGGTFEGCSSLRRVDIPSTIKKILNDAFSGCASLEEISLPVNLESVGNGVFTGCSALKTVVISTPTVSTWFRKMESLEQLVLENTVTSINTYAFQNCKNLKSVILSENLESIGNYAFDNTAIEEVDLPSSITSIGTGAFRNCNNLKHIQSQITNLFSTSAFTWTNTVLIVPKGLRSDYKSVSGWKNAVVFEDGETVYDKIHADDQGIKYTLNQDANNNVYYSVTGHTDILPTSIIIPNNIEGCPVFTVSNNAFTDCVNLEQVTFSEGLNSIDFSAFKGCIKLKEFVSQISDPTKTKVNTSSEVYERAHIIIPIGSKAAYLKSSSWNYFWLFEEGEDIVEYERNVTDEQGLIYKLGQSETSFYYSVTGHTDALADSVWIPETLNEIPVTQTTSSTLFKNCEILKWISIPSTFKYPYYGWKRLFEGCSNLTIALNEKNVSSFSGCDFLVGVEFGTNVDSLAYQAFYGCKNLEKVVFSEGVRSFASAVFSGCSSLREVYLPKTLKNIGNESFQLCTSLRQLNMQEGVEVIGSNAFGGCDSLHFTTLPSTVRSIGSSAFYGCTIDSLVIRENSNITSNSIAGCKINTVAVHASSLKSLNNSSIKKLYIGSEVEICPSLSGCSGVEIVKVDASNTLFDSREDCNAIIASATNTLLFGCKTTVIPETVRSIGQYAFSGCTGLTNICFNSSITSIGQEAFKGCTGLQHITSYIKNPFSLGWRCFDQSTLDSTTLEIPFGQSYFYQGWNFKNVVEMEGNEDEMTFIQFADSNTKRACVEKYDLNKDGEVSIDEAKQVTSISSFGNTIISSFDELKYFVNATEIANNCFNGYTRLKSISLPESINKIGVRAFYGCDSLETVININGVSFIDEYAFYGCKSLTDIELHSNIKEIGKYTFYGCTSLASVNIPSGVTSIGASAFQNCKSLLHISLPEGLQTIGDKAFQGSGLLTMTLPSTLISIGDYALAGNMIYCGLSTPITVGTLMSGASEVPMYVPQGSFKDFSSANGWKDFLLMGEYDENIDWTEGQTIIHLEEPGQLRLSIVELDDEEILRLKIVGQLNSTDLAYLMDGKGKIANLESLDLRDVTLVYDGGCYYSGSWSGISDTGFGGSVTELYLTENERINTYTSMGISPVTYYYYYGPNLKGLFADKPYKNIVMPMSVKKMTGEDFSGCKYLLNVEYPGTQLSTIASSAFSGCERLVSINLEYVDSVCSDAFYGCKMLQKVKGINHVKYIGASAFSGCKRLASDDGLMLLEGVDSIPNSAFLGCTSLNGVKFSDNLHYLGSSAFSGCKLLQSVSLPENLVSLNDYSFADCSMLQTVDFKEENILHVNYTTFENTPWMNNLPVENGIKYMGTIALNYDKSSEMLSSASATLDFREGTTQIADNFWKSLSSKEQQNVTKLTFPSSLRSIGDNAFANNYLSTLTLPVGLVRLGVSSFANSSNLTKLTLSENLKHIGKNAFSKCNQLLVIDYNVIDTEGESLFSGSASLEKVNVGAQVEKLPDQAFENCSNLTLVKFIQRNDDTPLSVGSSTFYGCSNLLSIRLPETTITIGDGAFGKCSSLASFVIPVGIQELNDNLFSECSSMVEVELHEGITTIGNGTFQSCSSLQDITLPKTVVAIGDNAFAGCTSLVTLCLPASLQSIGSAALSDCYHLMELTSEITNPWAIGELLPLSPNAIYEGYGITVAPGNTGFDMHYKEMTLYVPGGSKSKYQSTTGWDKFQNIIEIGGKMGDVNHDDAIDVTDAVLIIDEILMKHPANFDASLADVNSDGSIDVTDVVMVIDKILGKIELSREVKASQKDLSAYTAFQMDLTIPAGYVLEGVELTEMAKDSHKLAYNMLADGSCRVVVFSMDNEALPGAWDEVIRLNLKGQGDAFVNVDRAMFVTVGGERHELLINGTTAIASSMLNSQCLMLNNVYDLQGRRVSSAVANWLSPSGRRAKPSSLFTLHSSLKKGLYIANGKKIVK